MACRKFTSSFVGALAALCFNGYAAQACSWDRPGANPYTGEIPAAVDRYRELPAEVRGRLKERVRNLDYDEVVEIRRDTISGKDKSYSNLRAMHFGNGGFCEQVTRTKWKDEHTERGLVYCEQEHCILVPTVCRNVSRVDILSAAKESAPPAEIAHMVEPLRFPVSQPALLKTLEWRTDHYSPHTPLPLAYPPVHEVPEPGTLSLLSVAGAAFVVDLCLRKRRKLRA